MYYGSIDYAGQTGCYIFPEMYGVYERRGKTYECNYCIFSDIMYLKEAAWQDCYKIILLYNIF